MKATVAIAIKNLYLLFKSYLDGRNIWKKFVRLGNFQGFLTGLSRANPLQFQDGDADFSLLKFQLDLNVSIIKFANDLVLTSRGLHSIHLVFPCAVNKVWAQARNL